MSRQPRRVAVIESQVMGRNAIAVVAAFVQFPALAQLFGVEASAVVTEAGPPALATLWALSLLTAGILVAASYATRDPADSRVLEIGACLLLVAGSAVYGVAIWETVGPIGALWVLALVGSLAVNCGGRAFLLARQIMYVRRVQGRINEETTA